ncbi:hypothetical protein V8D89_016058 [Ganoderma adspersum]
MSISGVKPLRSTAPQLEGRPSFERDFGIGSHEVYADPQVVQREFDRVNERVDDVKKDLKAARDALDQKISGLETRLTTKIDTQKAYMDDKFEQQEEKFQQRMSQLQLNLDSALETHSETVTRRFDEVDERFSKVENRLDTMEGNVKELKDDVKELKDDVKELKDDMKQIKAMLQLLLTPGGVPPTPLASASSQGPFPLDPPEVVVHAASAPVAEPSSSSAPRQDVKPIDSSGSRLVEVFRTIRRQTSLGMGALAAFNKSKDRLDQ